MSLFVNLPASALASGSAESDTAFVNRDSAYALIARSIILAGHRKSEAVVAAGTGAGPAEAEQAKAKATTGKGKG